MRELLCLFKFILLFQRSVQVGWCCVSCGWWWRCGGPRHPPQQCVQTDGQLSGQVLTLRRKLIRSHSHSDDFYVNLFCFCFCFFSVIVWGSWSLTCDLQSLSSTSALFCPERQRTRWLTSWKVSTFFSCDFSLPNADFHWWQVMLTQLNLPLCFVQDSTNLRNRPWRRCSSLKTTHSSWECPARGKPPPSAPW